MLHRIYIIQWNPNIFPLGMILCNPAVEHNMATFWELSLAFYWWQ